jgi:hypothetical protein
MNTDAVFGRIDPRDASMVALKDMFQDNTKALNRINQHRGSSARAWNDNTEFATPNIIAKANE